MSDKGKFFNDIATIDITANSKWWLDNMNSLPHRVKEIETHHAFYRNAAKCVYYIEKNLTKEEKRKWLIDVLEGKVKPGQAFASAQMYNISRIIHENMGLYFKSYKGGAFRSERTRFGAYIVAVRCPLSVNTFRYEASYDGIREIVGKLNGMTKNNKESGVSESIAIQLNSIAERSTEDNVMDNLLNFIDTYATIKEVHE